MKMTDEQRTKCTMSSYDAALVGSEGDIAVSLDRPVLEALQRLRERGVRVCRHPLGWQWTDGIEYGAGPRAQMIRWLERRAR